MSSHAFLVEIARHENAYVLLGAVVILALAWLRVLAGYAQGNVAAPVRWRTVGLLDAAASPEPALPEQVTDGAWELGELNREFSREVAKVRGEAAADHEPPEPASTPLPPTPVVRRSFVAPDSRHPLSARRLLGYGAALAGVAVMTGFIHLVPGASRLANISMLYLLVVIATAVRFGRGAAIMASLYAFLASDWFFTAPRHTFHVQDPEEWLALGMFLVTAIVTGELTSLLRAHAEEARHREREAAALAEASVAVASQVDPRHALAEVLRRLAAVAELAAAAILIPEEAAAPIGNGALRLAVAASWSAEGRELPSLDLGAAAEAARRAFQGDGAVAWDGTESTERAGHATSAAPEPAYLPIGVEGRVLGVLCLRLAPGRPITASQRRAVEALTHHAAVVLERERLTRAETQAKVLEEADRLKTALLSMVSHDFRSPLASIKASASALAEEGAPLDLTVQHELLAGIEREADRLNGMVGNILALSRLEADAWRPRCEATDPAELVGTVLASFTPDQNRRIRVEVAPDVGEAWLDPVQMVQVLHNLVDNALKYSPPEGTIEVTAHRAGAAISLEVLDRGPGLPPGAEERVFERFYRAPDLRESSVPGVGIGLAVCRGLVEAHGGTLSAHLRPGGGSVFRVRVPAHTGAVATGEAKDHARSGD